MRRFKGAAPEWMTYLACFRANNGETLYVVLFSEVQLQKMIGNVQVVPPCTCHGEVRSAFTCLRADNSNSRCMPKILIEEYYGVRFVFVRITTAEDRVMRFHVSREESLKSNLPGIAIPAKEENNGTSVDKKVPEDVWPQVSCWT